MEHNSIILKRSLPVNLHQKDFKYFEKEIKREICGPATQEIENAIITSKGMVFEKFKLVKESLVAGVSVRLGLLFHLKQILSKKRILINHKKPAVTFDFWYMGYGHWMTETLSRILWLTKLNLDFTVIIPAGGHDFIFKSIEPFKLNSIISINEKEFIVAKKAILVNHTAPTGNYNEDLIQELRTIFRNHFSIKSSESLNERIYVSRKKSSRRRLINEEEVSSLLSLYGFKTICYEDYSFEREVQLSLQVKFMIGVHGAGLTNMMFMNENTSILEFRHVGDDSNLCYFSLASALKLKYYYQFGNYQETEFHLNNDIEIDLSELKINIELMLANG